jgi:hypothetical protein
VTQSDYHNRLIDTSADVTEDLRLIPTGPVYQGVSDALQAYTDTYALWNKASTTAGTLTSSADLTVDQSINATKGGDIDSFNADPQITAIQAHYNLPKVVLDFTAMQASLDKFNKENALWDTFTKANTYNDQQVTDKVAAAKEQSAHDFCDRAITIERTALTDYSTASPPTIWAVADQLTQKADTTFQSIVEGAATNSSKGGTAQRP